MPPFSSHGREQTFGQVFGFTLLEVMVAVAVIAIAFVTLIGAQSQSVAIATDSRFDTRASLLAQGKMAELSLLDYTALSDSTGDFGKDFPNFSWKAEVTELSEGDTGIKGSGGTLKAVDITVLVEEDINRSYTLRTIVLKKIAAVN
jgi:general secretion pathway protein I